MLSACLLTHILNLKEIRPAVLLSQNTRFQNGRHFFLKVLIRLKSYQIWENMFIHLHFKFRASLPSGFSCRGIQRKANCQLG